MKARLLINHELWSFTATLSEKKEERKHVEHWNKMSQFTSAFLMHHDTPQ